MTPQEIIQRLEQMDSQIICARGSRKPSIFKEAADLIRSLSGQPPVGELNDTCPMVLYFPDNEEREKFIRLVQKAKPNMRTRKLP